MSSNNQETMSPPHTINGDTHVDVTNPHQMGPLPLISSPSPPREYAVDPVVVSSRGTTKSVKVSAGKRRKVVLDDASTPHEGRKTRFGTGNPPSKNIIKHTTPKYRTAEGLKNATKSARQKQLHETFELHDTKVRELFHLTKFVSLVDYDAKAAKQDESEVFKEVQSHCMVSNCSSKHHMNYGRKRQMQSLVDESVQQDMP